MPSTPTFLDYVPEPLAFGTSGLRGLVKDITDIEAFISVRGALCALLATGDIHNLSTVLIAGDLRPSTPRIMGAAGAAIDDLGLQIENAGHIPTPALAAYAFSRRCASLMVTGSHIPFDRNGIKLYKACGELLKSDEAGIIEQMGRVREEQYRLSAANSRFDSKGMLKQPFGLPAVDPAAEFHYLERYRQYFAPRGLTGLRALVYQHSAVGRDLLPRILLSLGAEVEVTGRSETFIALDTENISAKLLTDMRNLAIEAAQRGFSPHVIVSTDGDSDRPLVIAVSNKASDAASEIEVTFLPGDLLGLVTAIFLEIEAAAIPISSNDALEKLLGAHGVKLQLTRIGSPFIAAALLTMQQSNHGLRIAGWEANGGFMLGTPIKTQQGELAALPTRDAVLPMLANLYAAKSCDFNLCKLWASLPPRFGCAGLIDDFPQSTSQQLILHLSPGGPLTEIYLEAGESDQGLPSGAAAFDDLDEAERAPWFAIKTLLEQFFNETSGFRTIARINVLDGIRIHFRNGDIAHLRPSGNAPQMRVYANADSKSRAEQIVAHLIDESDGILRRMERALVDNSDHVRVSA